MSIDRIVTAARLLKPAEFLRLRRELDRVEQALWDRELSRTTARMRKAKLTDAKIDRLVLRRRRESRA